MGCVASKLEDEEEAVSICKERKRQLKLAVERRHALAEAHCKYFRSLNGVAAAIDLFVARLSSPSSNSPYLITFTPHCPETPPPENVITNLAYLQQKPSETNHETMACESCASSTTSKSSEEKGEEKEGKKEEHPCHEYNYYMQMPQQMLPTQPDFGWDFFNPFDSVRTEVISSYRRYSDDDLKAVREEEGIPELEEEREELENKDVIVENGEGMKCENDSEVVTVQDSISQNREELKGLSMIHTQGEGRELLDGLKDIVDHFIRAYDSGKDVSRMLEVNKAHLQSGLEEIKEISTKIVQALTWHGSTSSRLSCKSITASITKPSSNWTEFKNDLFEDYGGMYSGSHSLTLERLYAWEKKLYEEVKAGDMTRKLYEKKCSRLRNQVDKGHDQLSMDKTKAAVKDLYAQILVAVRSAESISKKIQKLRDEELLLQIIELLRGLTRTYRVMLEAHEIQRKIISEVKIFNCPTCGKFSTESHRLATDQLEAELQNWRVCFTEYFKAQKAYVESLHGWLCKFIVPEVEFYSRSKNQAVTNGPPLLLICQDWLSSLQKLPDKMVSFAIKSLAKDIRALWIQQGEEQQQKRRVATFSKDLDRKLSSFDKVESRILDSKVAEQESEQETQNRNDYLQEKKNQLELFRKKLDLEKEKHQSYMQETQRIALSGLQSGLSRVFESLTEFTKASQKIYIDLVEFSENTEKDGNMSYIENGQLQENRG